MIYDKICLMVPTYKRMFQLILITDSALRLADDPTRLRFSYCINTTDTVSREYVQNRFFPSKDCWEIIDETTKQPNLSLYFNKMYNETRFNDPGTLVTELGDDMVFLTQGWDTKILEEMNAADGNAIVYCNDNYIAHDKCCVNLFVSRQLVEATRKPFMCAHFHADMIDVIWTMIGAMTGTLRYLPEVYIQHNHSTKKKEDEWDETFQRLSPVQKSANSPQNKRFAIAYSTIVAKNLINAGIGKWNVLQ